MNPGEFERGAATLKQRRNFANAGILLYSLAALAELGGQAFGLMLTGPATSGELSALRAVDMIYAVSFYASAVVVGMWIYRAHANLNEAGIKVDDITPGMAVGWFFVPFANLVMPFRAMRGLWLASRGDDQVSSETPPLVGAWWAFFLIGGFTMALARFLTTPDAQGINRQALAVLDIGIVLRLASAWLLFEIIGRITRMQATRVSIGDTFA